MKKLIAVLLIMCMATTLFACSKGADEASGGEVLGFVDTAYIFDIVQEHQTEAHDPGPATMIPYNNLSTSLLALDSGDITSLWMNQTLADYILAHNDKYEIYSGALDAALEKHVKTTYGMLTMKSSTDLFELLNDAILQLKADGTMDQLIENELLAYTASDPSPASLPVFEGAQTYKIAVTGDLPPTDFITADGKPAGFNVALLSAIADIAKVNFELVPVDSGAKIVALTARTVDAVFWMPYSYNCSVCGHTYEFAPEDTVMTESYFADNAVIIQCKPEA